MDQADYIICECDLEPLEAFVRQLEPDCAIKVVRQPSVGTTMVRAEDSVEGQPFYLGEALITECELNIDGQAGFGLCLGDEPVRSYCMAFLDALMLLSDSRLSRVESFLSEQSALIEGRIRAEHELIQRTKVDFKLMETE
jgi:alpha-D-ribose 1-methylphosphonate 5-triphosphate synthase subunit PhnG